MCSAYPLTGYSILVVEDEPLIALDLAEVFQSAGAQVVCGRNGAEARVALETGGLRAAVVDYGLANDDAVALCAELAQRGIPYMFYSGYSDLQESFPRNVVVQKPAACKKLISAMAGLISRSAQAA